MRVLIISFVAILLSFGSVAQDINTLIKEADSLEAIPKEIPAFLKFKDVVKLQPMNIYAVAKCSELCSRIGKRQLNKKVQADFYAAAKAFAELAIKIAPDNAEANCVMAMALGHLSMTKTNKEKIAIAKDIKKYADASVRLDPKNFKAWHVLGRWNYEISNYNVFEKAAAQVLYGGLPQASLQESINDFEKAHAITGGFVMNYFEMARAYKRNNDTKKAISLLKTMLTLPNHAEGDSMIKEEGKKLLQDWE